MEDTQEAVTIELQAPAAEEYQPGELASCLVTDAKVWKPTDLSQDIIGTLKSLFENCSIADEAARRYHVLDTWEARHFDRQHQYLDTDKGNGGWTVAGANQSGQNGNSINWQNERNLYATNIYSAQGDITTGALNRGKIKVTFAPRRSKQPQDVAAADEANKYKYIHAKANPHLQPDIFQLAWTDCRSLTWTATWADKRWGTDSEGNPLRRELSKVFGVLETKLPMMADKLCDCGYVMGFEEMDYAVARAMMPWMGKKIKPSWGGAGELEFERIARINTRIGLAGRYLTGTMGVRETTLAYVWLRPGMYYDDNVTDGQRAFLQENFASGCFMVFSGTELCMMWEESVDDHCELAMYTRGFGQSRRSLGTGDIPIQKRINIWADLWDKFIRGSIPLNLLESRAFNAEAINQLESDPRRFVEVALDEGQSMQDVIGQTSAAQPIQGMSEMFQWYVGPLIQSIDGATPALFGGGEGEDNTVGATQIRLQQSLERFGPVWNEGNRVIAKATEQAAKCCARNGSDELSDTVSGEGDITVSPALLRGEFECSPETSGQIPESGSQRQAKIMELINLANTNPQIASLVGTPSNAREIVNGLDLQDVITIDEANAEDGALEDIETLLDTEPLANPLYEQLQQELAEAKSNNQELQQAAAQMIKNGQPPYEQHIAAGEQLEKQIQQMTQQLQQTPQFLPYVPVSQKDDEDHATIKATVFAWMQEPDGRALRRAAPKDPKASKKWLNISLYYDGHSEMAAKFQKPAQTQPKVNITGKLSPEQQAQILMMGGVQTDPETLTKSQVSEQTIREYTPVSELETTVKRKE